MVDMDYTEKKARKAKSRGATGGKKRLTPFNKFMKTEMARLKDDEPTISHQERFKMATQNWRTAAANPKAELP